MFICIVIGHRTGRFGIFDLERASRRSFLRTQLTSQYKSECRILFTRLDIIHMYRDWASDRVDLAYSIWRGWSDVSQPEFRVGIFCKTIPIDSIRYITCPKGEWTRWSKVESKLTLPQYRGHPSLSRRTSRCMLGGNNLRWQFHY
jgi:hypothetical protein